MKERLVIAGPSNKREFMQRAEITTKNVSEVDNEDNNQTTLQSVITKARNA